MACSKFRCNCKTKIVHKCDLNLIYTSTSAESTAHSSIAIKTMELKAFFILQ